MIVYRKRLSQNALFAEYLLVPDENSSLILPEILPERYHSRIISTRIYKNRKCIEVRSNHTMEPEYITNEDILKGFGVWVLADDCKKKGDFIPEKLDGIAQFMGIPILYCDIVIQFDASLIFSVFTANDPSKTYKVLSLYHGTDKISAENLSRHGIFNESQGMLGMGAYFGTFWKAARFACFSQTYEKRSGAVFRVIAICKTMQEFPNATWSCNCGNSSCIAPSISDHQTLWRSNFDGAHASQSITPIGVCKDGSPKYALRNEEWVIKPDLVRITHWALIDNCEMHYNPMQRNLHIN